MRAADERVQEPHGIATITGVAFFDDVGNQTGVAPNGVELHPMID